MKSLRSITREQFFQFIKKPKDDKGITKATQHYLDYFDRYHTTGRIRNCNWSAGIFNFGWLLYRRMYASFFLLVTLECAMEMLEICLTRQFSSELEVWVSAALILFMGYYGDYIYLRHASHKIAKGVTHGGVSWVPVALLAFINWLTVTFILD